MSHYFQSNKLGTSRFEPLGYVIWSKIEELTVRWHYHQETFKWTSKHGFLRNKLEVKAFLCTKVRSSITLPCCCCEWMTGCSLERTIDSSPHFKNLTNHNENDKKKENRSNHLNAFVSCTPYLTFVASVFPHKYRLQFLHIYLQLKF